jgi:ABC-type Fe3+-hydroxamate transport system substrate-binding protein
MTPENRSRRAAAALLRALLLALPWALAAGAEDGPPPARRIVSLNPSLTAILVFLDVADRLVGVDVWSQRQNPGLAALPTVGGLYNPSVEALVAVSPDLVVYVPSAEQRDFHGQLSSLGVRVEAFDPLRFDDVLASIERLGRITGTEPRARERTGRIRGVRADLERAVAGRRALRTVLILQRDPLFVVGGGNFIDEMLASVGAANVASGWNEPYPRVSLEWLVTQAPEVILDSSHDAEPPERYWARFESLPAVASGRVVRLPVGTATLPGPHLDEALRLLARSVHGIDATSEHGIDATSVHGVDPAAGAVGAAP